MRSRLGLFAACAFVFLLGLFPGICYAAEAPANGGFTASEIQTAPVKPPTLKTQDMSWVDGGYTGSCEWDIYYQDGWYYLAISPQNGSYGWIESTHYVPSTDGSDAPWYGYSNYIRGITVTDYVLASDSCDCMFCDCPNLEWANLSGLDTSDVTDMENMFFGCQSLETIWVTTLWSTEKVAYSGKMFAGCYSLVGGNGTRFSTSNYKYDTALWANIDYPNDPGYFTSLYLGDATVRVNPSVLAYSAMPLYPSATVSIGNDTLTPGEDYTLQYANNLNAGIATVTVSPSNDSIYEGSASQTFIINPASNKAKAAKTKVKKTVKVSKLKKRAQNISLPKVTTSFGTAKWKVVSKDKKKVLKLKGKKITVKKGAKKGKYTIKVKAQVPKTANYTAAKTKVVTVKVTVK